MERIYVRSSGRCVVPAGWRGANGDRYEYCEAACGSGACWPAQLKRGVVCAAGYEGTLTYDEAVCESVGAVGGAGTFVGVSGTCVRSCQVGPWGPWGVCSSGCGGGTQTRERTLLVAPEAPATCGGPLNETRPCVREPRLVLVGVGAMEAACVGVVAKHGAMLVRAGAGRVGPANDEVDGLTDGGDVTVGGGGAATVCGNSEGDGVP